MSNTTTTEQMVEELVFRCLDNQMAARIHEAKAALLQRVRDLESRLHDAENLVLRISAYSIPKGQDIAYISCDEIQACRDYMVYANALRARLEQERKEQ